LASRPYDQQQFETGVEVFVHGAEAFFLPEA
jgi:hypothetical protein